MSIRKQASFVTHRTPDSRANQQFLAEKALGENPLVIALIRKITQCAKVPDNSMIEIALDVRELRRIVEAEKINGGVSWFEWAPKNLNVGSRTRLYLLHSLAESVDPQAELDRVRRLGCNRSKNFRGNGKKKKILEEERVQLVTWAKKAPLSKVSRVLKQIPQLT